MVEPVALKYRAFISYSHADTGWAKWLHRGLESFPIDKDLVGRETATGAIPATLRPIFRDREDFTAGHTLTDQTLTALDASHALIVICSPAAAKSHYVTEEIRLFRSRHPGRPVIPLIVAGKPGDPALECMPASLRFKLGAEGQITDEPSHLLAADAREEGDGKDLALAKVLAGLLGVSSDDIFRRAERERRRQARVRRRIQALGRRLDCARGCGRRRLAQSGLFEGAALSDHAGGALSPHRRGRERAQSQRPISRMPGLSRDGGRAGRALHDGIARRARLGQRAPSA